MNCQKIRINKGAFLLQNSQWIIHSCLVVDTVFLLAFLILSLTFMSMFVINRPIYDISGQRTKRLLGSTEACNHSFWGGCTKKSTFAESVYIISNICWTDDVIDRKINAKKDKQVNQFYATYYQSGKSRVTDLSLIHISEPTRPP